MAHVKGMGESIRFYVNYCNLNELAGKDAYLVLCIDDALDTLQGVQYVSFLGLRSGYREILMSVASKSKTAFIPLGGFHEFNVTLFGLCDASATSACMNYSAPHGLKWHTCICYLGDVIVFSSSFEQHLPRLLQMFL